MSIIGIKIKEENKLDPALFAAMFVAVFFLPFFIAFQNYTLSFLAVFMKIIPLKKPCSTWLQGSVFY